MSYRLFIVIKNMYIELDGLAA